MKPYLRCLKFGSRCAIKRVRALARRNNMKKKADMKKNETERCIEDLKKVMDSHPGLSNAQIQYIDRWLLSTYIKPEPKVYY